MQKARPLLCSSSSQFWCAHGSRVPGLRTRPESSERPVIGTCRNLGIMVFAATPATKFLHRQCFRSPFGPRTRDPGLRPDLSRASGGRARMLQLHDARPARAFACVTPRRFNSHQALSSGRLQVRDGREGVCSTGWRGRACLTSRKLFRGKKILVVPGHAGGMVRLCFGLRPAEEEGLASKMHIYFAGKQSTGARACCRQGAVWCFGLRPAGEGGTASLVGHYSAGKNIRLVPGHAGGRL